MRYHYILKQLKSESPKALNAGEDAEQYIHTRLDSYDNTRSHDDLSFVFLGISQANVKAFLMIHVCACVYMSFVCLWRPEDSLRWCSSGALSVVLFCFV